MYKLIISQEKNVEYLNNELCGQTQYKRSNLASWYRYQRIRWNTLFSIKTLGDAGANNVTLLRTFKTTLSLREHCISFNLEKYSPNPMKTVLLINLKPYDNQVSFSNGITARVKNMIYKFYNFKIK